MRDNKVYIQTFTRVLRFYCDLWRTTVLRGEHSLQCTNTNLQTYGKKIVGILVYAPYKKSAIHKFSTVRAMPIIADAMKQDQVWNENLLNISYKS